MPPRCCSCPCRPSRRPGCCCPGNSPGRPASRPAARCRWRPAPWSPGSSSPSELIGSTDRPCSSIRVGYSFVPCAEPRYLTIRRRRVAIWLMTRWSRKITQSLTYSSRPWRVSVLAALLAGDDRGHALVLEPAEQPAQFRPQDGLVGQPGEQRLQGVEHDPLGADRCRSSRQPDEQPSRSYSPVSSISLRSMWT